MSALLEVQGLVTRYGRAQVLFDLSFAVRAGEVVVLLGRNGAGKSTTLRTLAGLVPAAAGTVRFDGLDVTHAPTHRIVRAGLGYVPEDRRIFTGLTVDENLEVGRRPAPSGQEPWTPERLFELFPNLARMRRRRGAFMSGGEQQMLAIARTLMGNPRLVLLDEPSEGLAPVIVEQMARAILRMKRAGLAVLLSEQNLPFARAVAERAYVIESGQLRHAATMAELLANEAVLRRWLSVRGDEDAPSPPAHG
ncbi:MAG: ABC transporter ATP-binding protein [Pseudomonadota bacterium]